MVWILILLTVVTYGFIMKHVLSNIMKDRQPVRETVPYQKRSQAFTTSNLITTESTR
ncbi:hypothetical protein HP456_01255 [Bacillus haikouensis]|jgi:hypothetical protein|uniref:hypothetical protein n=1 Tax=Bacillus haikouensis TaxID=1510468 RepID=UPI001553F8FB|nr:hypothetical protein [Bacillus haikouensis]NQD64549.1 hypothetical protein [Bacillus haikouensis]